MRIVLEPQEYIWLESVVADTDQHPRIRRRAKCVLLRASGLSITEIFRHTGMNRHHIYTWLRRWDAGGLPALLGLRGARPTTPT